MLLIKQILYSQHSLHSKSTIVFKYFIFTQISKKKLISYTFNLLGVNENKNDAQHILGL